MPILVDDPTPDESNELHYFEITVLSNPMPKKTTIAIGLATKPYPPFRYIFTIFDLFHSFHILNLLTPLFLPSSMLDFRAGIFTRLDTTLMTAVNSMMHMEAVTMVPSGVKLETLLDADIIQIPDLYFSPKTGRILVLRSPVCDICGILQSELMDRVK